jgi:hypothetical protein
MTSIGESSMRSVRRYDLRCARRRQVSSMMQRGRPTEHACYAIRVAIYRRCRVFALTIAARPSERLRDRVPMPSRQLLPLNLARIAHTALPLRTRKARPLQPGARRSYVMPSRASRSAASTVAAVIVGTGGTDQ